MDEADTVVPTIVKSTVAPAVKHVTCQFPLIPEEEPLTTWPPGLIVQFATAVATADVKPEPVVLVVKRYNPGLSKVILLALLTLIPAFWRSDVGVGPKGFDGLGEPLEANLPPYPVQDRPAGGS